MPVVPVPVGLVPVDELPLVEPFVLVEPVGDVEPEVVGVSGIGLSVQSRIAVASIVIGASCAIVPSTPTKSPFGIVSEPSVLLPSMCVLPVMRIVHVPPQLMRLSVFGVVDCA